MVDGAQMCLSCLMTLGDARIAEIRSRGAGQGGEPLIGNAKTVICRPGTDWSGRG